MKFGKPVLYKNIFFIVWLQRLLLKTDGRTLPPSFCQPSSQSAAFCTFGHSTLKSWRGSDYPLPRSRTIHSQGVWLSTHQQSDYPLSSGQTIHSPAVRLPTHQQSDYPLTSSQTIHSPAVRLSSTHQQSDFQQISSYSTVEYPLFERILLLLKSDQADQLFLWSLCPGCKNYKLSCPAYRFPITIAA